MVYAKFGWNWFSGSRKEAKNVQIFTTDDGQLSNGKKIKKNKKLSKTNLHSLAAINHD